VCFALNGALRSQPLVAPIHAARRHRHHHTVGSPSSGPAIVDAIRAFRLLREGRVSLCSPATNCRHTVRSDRRRWRTWTLRLQRRNAHRCPAKRPHQNGIKIML
jgi:hypothetical protein